MSANGSLEELVRGHHVARLVGTEVHVRANPDNLREVIFEGFARGMKKDRHSKPLAAMYLLSEGHAHPLPSRGDLA